MIFSLNIIYPIYYLHQTPLHHAAKRGHLACLAALLEYEVNLDLKNTKGKKALDVALDGKTGDCKKCADYIVEKMSEFVFTSTF